MRGILVALLAMCFCACESSRAGHPCVGVTQDNRRTPGVEYEVSTPNVVIGVILSETLIVPLLVVFTGLYCPVEPPRQAADAGTVEAPQAPLAPKGSGGTP